MYLNIECRACFAMLDVTRVIWLVAGLPRACCNSDLIYTCLMHPYFASQDTLASRTRLTSFVQPLGQARARVKVSCMHTLQDSSRKFSVCAQGSSVNFSMILLCLYIFIECI